jgi:catalase
MITFLFSPYGIPANYRQMQGSGVNTYKWVNAAGEGVLVKYHWEPVQGIKNLTQEQAEAIQAKNFNHATQDLYEAIEQGNFPQWELLVQMMSTPSLILTRLMIPNFGPKISFRGCR